MNKNVIVITGGQRSGKSSYAQKLALPYLPIPDIWPHPGCGMKNTVPGLYAIRRTEDRNGPIWKKRNFSANTTLPEGLYWLNCVTLWATNFFFDNKADVALSLSQLKTEFEKLTSQRRHLYLRYERNWSGRYFGRRATT